MKSYEQELKELEEQAEKDRLKAEQAQKDLEIAKAYFEMQKRRQEGILQVSLVSDGYPLTNTVEPVSMKQAIIGFLQTSSKPVTSNEIREFAHSAFPDKTEKNVFERVRDVLSKDLKGDERFSIVKVKGKNGLLYSWRGNGTKKTAPYSQGRQPSIFEISTSDRVLSTIAHIGRVVLAHELYTHIYATDDIEKNQKNTISTILTQLKTSGKLNRYKKNNNNNLTYWGLPDWFRSDGLPKDVYVK